MKTRLNLTLFVTANLLAGIGVGAWIATNRVGATNQGGSSALQKQQGTSSLVQVERETHPHREQPRDQAGKPPKPQWPASPREAIASAMANLKGNELREQLYEAAEHYARNGIDSLAELCLALPPGTMGQHPLEMAAKHALTNDYPREMIAFLKREEAQLTPEWVSEALESLVDYWERRDALEALQYLAETPLLDRGEKERLMKDVLLNPNDEGDNWGEKGPYPEILAFVEGLGDEALERALKSSVGYLAASFRARDPAETIAALPWSEAENPVPLSNALEFVIKKMDDPGPALAALAASNYPDREEILVDCYKIWIDSDLNSALGNFSTVKDPGTRDRIIEVSWPTIWEYDPAAAKQWIDTIDDETLRSNLQETLRSINSTTGSR